MGDGYRSVNLEISTIAMLEDLQLLTHARGINSTIEYLLRCYQEYCELKGIRNYEMLEEAHKKRGF